MFLAFGLGLRPSRQTLLTVAFDEPGALIHPTSSTNKKAPFWGLFIGSSGGI